MHFQAGVFFLRVGIMSALTPNNNNSASNGNASNAASAPMLSLAAPPPRVTRDLREFPPTLDGIMKWLVHDTFCVCVCFGLYVFIYVCVCVFVCVFVCLVCLSTSLRLKASHSG